MTPGERAGRVLRGVRMLLLVVVATTLVDVAPPRARAQEGGGGLAGYQGRAAASGLHALYNPEGLLPVPPPVDLGAPDALTTITSGPATFARASVADPGDLLASPEALLVQASPDYPGGIIPPYPFRITASSGVGEPAVESHPAPGLRARVEVGEGTSAAVASTPAVDVPAVATVGSMSASTSTETDGSTVTVHARSEVSDLNVLGLLTIGSVVTDLTATSNGTDTELSGGTRIVDATMLGTPVTIDADGVHPAGQPSLFGGLLGPLVHRLNDTLRQAGLTLTVADPVEITGGDTDERSSYGLRIGIELSSRTLPALAALIDALPPLENPVPGLPSIEDVLALAQARHLVAIEVGRGSVSLLARTGAPLDGSASTPTPTGSAATVDRPGSAPSFAPVDPGTSAPRAAEVGGGAAEQAARSIPSGAGVGALVLLALLAMPFVGDRIARMTTAVLATDRSIACTWEER